MTEFERELIKAFERYDKSSSKEIRTIQRQLNRTLNSVYEMLAEMEDEEGYISRRKLYEVERKINEFEREYRKEYDEQMNKVIEAAAGFAILAALKKFPDKRDEIDVESFKRLVRANISNSVAKDGRHLSQRTWGKAIELRSKISNAVRQGILSGHSTADIMKEVKRISNADEWKIKRLVSSERNNAYRLAVMKSARTLSAEYVQFYDGTCGHKNHHTHKCYELANIDKYGLGLGVYKATDTEIIFPHPQCTSTIIPIIDE